MKSNALASAALAVLLSTGCGGLRPPDTATEPWVKAGGARAVTDSDSLLMYFEYLRKLPAADLGKEQESVRQLYASARSDFNRVRYAMALSVSGAASADEARALEALEPVAKNSAAELRSLALLLSLQIQEQRRAHGLQQKLDALRSLDKSLLERGK